jgi:rRNA-processing protein FCF1
VADGVEVVHAPGLGDDTLAALAGGRAEPVVLVTADRQLAERARHHGADVVSPIWLLNRLPS